ncbi:MAG TPA: sugar phosphate nucleotidyltransferase [Candidatus Binatia bacterium]
MAHKTSSADGAFNRCAIILAAGEGVRLRSFVKTLRGDTLPKQYVRFLGSRSMLETTFHRAQRLIPWERLFTVVSANHLKYPEVTRQLAAYPEIRVVVQPIDRDTGIGLLLPLAHLFRRYPDSTVAVFPSDHFVREEDRFMTHVDAAFRLVEQQPAKIVLLGVAPNRAEPEYGYIVPGEELRGPIALGVREVCRIIEKPQPAVARELVLRGGLWNTLVVVFKTKTFLNQVRRSAPFLHSSFERIQRTIATPSTRDLLKELYLRMQPVNLSRGLLEILPKQRPSPLWVLPVRDVYWSDWGAETRIRNVLGEIADSSPLNEARENRVAIW